MSLRGEGGKDFSAIVEGIARRIDARGDFIADCVAFPL
jgi:hypothetical protein